jgi:hypothetical protein
MDVLVHAGYIKTGSTWLQKHFFPLVQNADYIDRKFIFNQLVKIEDRNFVATEFLDNLKKHSKTKIIISQENLIGGIYQKHLKRIETANRIKSVLPDAKIIIFIRNQAEIISSAYSMHLKCGETCSITDYIFNKKLALIHNSDNDFVYDFLKFDKIISLYQGLFGKDNVKVFLYEDLLVDNIKFLRNFKEMFNFEIDIDSLDFTRENVRLRKRLYKLVRITNLFTKHDVKFVSKSYILNVPFWGHYSLRFIKKLNKYKIFGSIPSSYEILGQTNYEYICEYFKESNNILFNNFCLKDIKKYNYPL